MSYRDSLEAAGAEVLQFAKFGDYSGQWFAKVRYNGEAGWIQDWYGSCSYCDAFQAEFDWDSDFVCEEDVQKRLANFGKRYLGTILPAEHYLPKLDESADWDGNAADAALWIRKIEGL